ILLAALLDALCSVEYPPDIATCARMAPAWTQDTFDTAYRPLLADAGPLRIRDLTIYNLKDDLERDDTVTPLYRKSLLYLVSNSFEGLSLSLLNFAGSGLPVSASSRLFYATSATAPSGGASTSKAATR
ncbi:MAG: hypothetical protein OXI55_01675, partial [Gammaproteobacteria bacterium]|nr:hypothetical protein [Gammaproteobacteria bacterium]